MNRRLVSLWEQSLLGDQSAFLELHKLMTPRLWGLLQSKGAPNHETEDVIQETWEHALKSQSFDSKKGKFDSWLFRIAIHALIDQWRRGARSKATGLFDDIDVQDSSPLPEDCMFLLEQVEQLGHCMEQLEPVGRHAIRAKFWEQLSYRDAAVLLEISVAQFKNSLWKARRNLLKCMGLFEPVNFFEPVKN